MHLSLSRRWPLSDPSGTRALVAGGDAHLTRVVCACRPGQEGTPNCNFGPLCGALSIGGRDAGAILIREGLAHPYICGRDELPATAAVVLKSARVLVWGDCLTLR
jgi:hypothetical protein